MKWYKVPGFDIELTKYGNTRDAITKKIRNHFKDKDNYIYLKGTIKDK